MTEPIADNVQAATNEEQKMTGPRVVFTRQQKEAFNLLLPDFLASSKKGEAKEEAYAKLIQMPIFRKPQTHTPEQWKRSLTRWFDNNSTKKITQARPKQPENSSSGIGSSSTVAPPLSSSSSNKIEKFTWAQYRALAKLFSSITASEIVVPSGPQVFAAAQEMTEDEAVVEWDKLSNDEKERWEHQAASECDIERNQKLFVDALRTLLRGCLQFGHLGCGEIVTFIAFDEGFHDGRRIISSNSIVASWDPKSRTQVRDIFRNPEELTRTLTTVLNDSLKSEGLKGLNLKTEIPVDANGFARFPPIPNYEDLTKKALRGIYEDFMKAIWHQAGYTGNIRYDQLEESPDRFYDSSLFPDDMRLKDANQPGGWFEDLIRFLLQRFSCNGTALTLKRAADRPPSEVSKGTLEETVANEDQVKEGEEDENQMGDAINEAGKGGGDGDGDEDWMDPPEPAVTTTSRTQGRVSVTLSDEGGGGSHELPSGGAFALTSEKPGIVSAEIQNSGTTALVSGVGAVSAELLSSEATAVMADEMAPVLSDDLNGGAPSVAEASASETNSSNVGSSSNRMGAMVSTSNDAKAIIAPKRRAIRRPVAARKTAREAVTVHATRSARQKVGEEASEEAKKETLTRTTRSTKRKADEGAKEALNAKSEGRRRKRAKK